MAKFISHTFTGPIGKTSLRLEAALWDGLEEVCRREEWTRSEMISVAQAAYRDRGIGSAVRTYLVMYFRMTAG